MEVFPFPVEFFFLSPWREQKTLENRNLPGKNSFWITNLSWLLIWKIGQGLIRFSSQFQPTQCNYGRPSGELRWRRRRRLFFDLGNVGFWMIIRLRWWVLKSMAIAHESPQIIVTVFDSNLCGLLGGGSKIWFGITVPSCSRVHQFINPSWPSDSFGLWDCQQNPMSSCQIAGSVSTKWVNRVCDGLARFTFLFGTSKLRLCNDSPFKRETRQSFGIQLQWRMSRLFLATCGQPLRCLSLGYISFREWVGNKTVLAADKCSFWQHVLVTKIQRYKECFWWQNRCPNRNVFF